MMSTAEKLPSAPPAVARSGPTPSGWGKDELTKFLQETHQQQYATFVKKAVGRLIAIQGLRARLGGVAE